MIAARFSSICGTLMMALAVAASPAHAAESYPSKPGRLILPFGAGGSTDVVGRIFAQAFSEAWGQTLVVDNRAGAAGIIGTELGARAAPDGYTIFTYGINQAITAALYSKLPYDHLRDFTLISLYATMPNILCVTPSLAGLQRRRIRQAHEGESRKAQIRILGHRRITPSHDGVLHVGDGHQADPRAVQEFGAGLYRHDHRRDPGLLLQSARPSASRKKRKAACAGGHVGETRAAGARPADDHRIRHSEFRCHRLAGLCGAESDAAADRFENPRVDDESARRSPSFRSGSSTTASSLRRSRRRSSRSS